MLTFDYLGALGASLLFPLVLVPKLGLVRVADAVRAVNVGVALWTTVVLRERAGRAAGACRSPCVAALALLVARHAVRPNDILQLAEGNLYADEIILRADNAVSAHRAHRVEGRPAPVPELATCSSARATSIATTRRWCIPGWRHCRQRGGC